MQPLVAVAAAAADPILIAVAICIFLNIKNAGPAALAMGNSEYC